ncbi:MAG: hypothetical protein GX893_05745 [Firmicutes bacterium]|nr:hypothetical protein [Bacillota bacterium]
MKKKTIILSLLLLLTIAVFSGNRLYITVGNFGDFLDSLDTGEISREELLAGKYYSMVDEDGREIMVTGRKIHVGDEYLTADNKLYRVYRVRNYVAYARYIREVGTVFAPEPNGIIASLYNYLVGGVQPVQKDVKENNKGEKDDSKALNKGIIGIYHTHNAESYVPTDGTDSINGKGGIHHVGVSFAKALKEKGIKVIYNDTLHLPHDRGAYRRSRVTAEKILKQNPDVIFDVHRDAGPPEAYAATVEKKPVTQVQFVVGRQNPYMQTVRQFALDLKNTADKIHPNLVKGIFLARGNYNQDLTPTSLLIEVGTHLNEREKAQEGAALFADVVSYYFYGSKEGPEEADEEQAAPATERPAADGGDSQNNMRDNLSRAAVRNTFWMLALTIVIAVVFYFINTPLASIRERLKPLFLQILPYTEKGDLFLAAAAKKINEMAAQMAAKTAALVRRGDHYAAYWQDKIESSFLTLKEKSRHLRERNKLK